MGKAILWLALGAVALAVAGYMVGTYTTPDDFRRAAEGYAFISAVVLVWRWIWLKRQRRNDETTHPRE